MSAQASDVPAGAVKAPLNERAICRAVARQTLGSRCLVLVENCSWTGHECDVLAVTQDLRIIDIEVKISIGDLRRDASKDKWWRKVLSFEPGPPQLLSHPPKVWKHYYAMPISIWSPTAQALICSESSGVLLVKEMPSGQLIVREHRKAKPSKHAAKLDAKSALDVARLGNIRLWDAYAKLDGISH